LRHRTGNNSSFFALRVRDLVALVSITYDTSYRRGVEQLGSSLGS
jgi:hypothetical protein